MTSDSSARALAMGRGALARAGEPDTRRQAAGALGLERTARVAPLRSLSIPIMRPTNCARAASRSGRMSWGQYGNRVGVAAGSRAAEAATMSRRASMFPPLPPCLHPGRAAPCRRGRPRDRHPRLDPRIELGPALRGRARPDVPLDGYARKDNRPSARRACRTPSWDFSPNTLKIETELGLLYDSSLMADEDCYELVMDGNARRGSSRSRSNGSATMPSIS